MDLALLATLGLPGGVATDDAAAGDNLMEAVAVLCGLMDAVAADGAATGSGVSARKNSTSAAMNGRMNDGNFGRGFSQPLAKNSSSPCTSDAAAAGKTTTGATTLSLLLAPAPLPPPRKPYTNVEVCSSSAQSPEIGKEENVGLGYLGYVTEHVKTEERIHSTSES